MSYATFFQLYSSGQRLPRAWLIVGDKTEAERIAYTLIFNKSGENILPLHIRQLNESPFFVRIPSDLGVKDVRHTLESALHLLSVEGNQVFFLEDLDRANAYVHNSLLKALEESPTHIYFVATAHQCDPIPKTVRSRMRVVYVKSTAPKGEETHRRLWTNILEKQPISTWLSDFYATTASSATMHKACALLIELLHQKTCNTFDAHHAQITLDIEHTIHKAQKFNISSKSLFFEIYRCLEKAYLN